MLKWRSTPLQGKDLPVGLIWQKEKPNPDYKVNLAFATMRDKTYRRVTFEDGFMIFAQIERAT